MDEGSRLRVIAVDETTVTVQEGTTQDRYRWLPPGTHQCREPRSLKPDDGLIVIRPPIANEGILVQGPCGCELFLYEREEIN